MMRFCYLIGDRVPFQHEPTAATLAMQPLFPVQALGIAAHEQVIRPFLIGQGIRFGRPGDIGFAPVTEFTLVACAAPGTFYQQHVPVPLSARPQQRRVRR